MRQAIGRYSITGTLGEGGMGIVYTARDEQLGRSVAIKMLRGAAEPAARERLFREARSAASLTTHPSASSTRSASTTGNCSSRWSCCRGRRSPRVYRVVRCRSGRRAVALGVLHGLEALHRQGLVHRDLKPSNIFLTPHGVKLLDFGLVTAAHDAGGIGICRRNTADATGHRRRHSPVPRPRAAAGWRGGHARGPFAVGAVLYEMLAGKPPFAGGSAVEVFHAILYEQPPVLTGGPAVGALDRVVNRSLAKNKNDRYQAIDAMAQDLRAALALGDTGTGASPRALTRLIVLPFRILRADPDTDFLAFSLADALTSSLSGLQSLVVARAPRPAGSPARHRT